MNQKGKRRRHHAIEIVEWPGCEPREVNVDVTPDVFKALVKSRVSIPLKKSADLATFAGLPWGSLVAVQTGRPDDAGYFRPGNVLEGAEGIAGLLSLLRPRHGHQGDRRRCR